MAILARDLAESPKGIYGKALCSALSSWRLTTSGSALDNQARRLSSRLLMLLMLQVATLTKSFLSLQLLVCCAESFTSPGKSLLKARKAYE